MVADACFDVVAARDGSLPVFVLPSVPQVREGLSLLLPDTVSQVFMMLATVSRLRFTFLSDVYRSMINYSHNNYFYTFCEKPFIIEILSHNSDKDQLSVQMFVWLSVLQQGQGAVICTAICLIVCLSRVTRSGCLHRCLFDCLSNNSDKELLSAHLFVWLSV